MVNSNTQKTQEALLPHRLILDERRHLEVTGVKEVLRFDETQVLLRTMKGLLGLQGEGLRLQTLNPEGGRVVVDGTVNTISYLGEGTKGGILKRLLG